MQTTAICGGGRNLKPSLQETQLLLPAFVLGTAALAVLNIVFAVK